MNEESNQKWLISDKHPFHSYCRAVNRSHTEGVEVEEEEGEELLTATIPPFSCEVAPRGHTAAPSVAKKPSHGLMFEAKIVGEKN